MAKAVRGDGSQDAETRILLRKAVQSVQELKDHVSRPGVRRNMSSKVADEVHEAQRAVIVTVSEAASVATVVKRRSEKQDTAVGGRGPTGRLRRRRADGTVSQ